MRKVILLSLALVLVKNKLELMENFGKGLAKLLRESESARRIIKSEAIKKINYDYDVLYDLIKDESIEHGETFENRLLRYVDKNDLSQIKEIVPTLTIFVPKLPEESFSADNWDVKKEIPDVAIRWKNRNDVIAFTGKGEEYSIDGCYIPGYPIVVVKENERIVVNESNTKSTCALIQNPNSDIAFTFTDQVFDNISDKITTKAGPTPTPTPDNLAKIYQAYTVYQNTDGWQRDYIYYDITPTSQRGSLKKNFKECLCSFQMVGDPMGAYKKISDSPYEPKFIPQGPDRNSGRAICWTDGEFEFKVSITYGNKQAIGTMQLTSFRATPEQLFDTHLEVATSRGQIVYIVNDIYGLKRRCIDLPLFEWSLENFTSMFKIGIEEVDDDIRTTQTAQTTTEYATNFEYNSSSGETNKVGLKYGSSEKVTMVTSFVIERTEKNDELGEVNINFGDDVIISDQPIVYTEPRRGTTSYYPRYNPKYSTGWYKIEVAPLKMY